MPTASAVPTKLQNSLLPRLILRCHVSFFVIIVLSSCAFWGDPGEIARKCCIAFVTMSRGRSLRRSFASSFHLFAFSLLLFSKLSEFLWCNCLECKGKVLLSRCGCTAFGPYANGAGGLFGSTRLILYHISKSHYSPAIHSRHGLFVDLTIFRLYLYKNGIALLIFPSFCDRTMMGRENTSRRN